MLKLIKHQNNFLQGLRQHQRWQNAPNSHQMSRKCHQLHGYAYYQRRSAGGGGRTRGLYGAIFWPGLWSARKPVWRSPLWTPRADYHTHAPGRAPNAQSTSPAPTSPEDRYGSPLYYKPREKGVPTTRQVFRLVPNSRNWKQRHGTLVSTQVPLTEQQEKIVKGSEDLMVQVKAFLETISAEGPLKNCLSVEVLVESALKENKPRLVVDYLWPTMVHLNYIPARLLLSVLDAAVILKSWKVFEEMWRMILEREVMRNENHTRLWAELIKGFTMRKDVESAMRMMEYLEEKGTRADWYFYKALCEVVVATEREDFADRIYEKFVGKKIFKNIQNISSVLHVMFHFKKWYEVQDIYNEFQKMKWKNDNIWNTLIQGYCRAGMLQKAYEVYLNMRTKTDLIGNDYIYSTLVSHLSKDPLWVDKAKAIAEESEKLGVQKTAFYGASLISFYSTVGDFEKCKAIFKEVKESGVQLNVVFYTSIISATATEGFIEEALRLFYEMLSIRIKPNVFTLTCLLSHCEQQKYISEGKRLIRSAMALAETNALVFNTILNFLIKVGDLEEARSLFDQRNPTELDILGWNMIIHGYSQKRDLAEVERLYQTMLKYIEPDSSTAVAIINACGSKLQFEKGEAYIETFKDLKHHSLTVCKINFYGKFKMEKAIEEFENHLELHPKLAYSSHIFWGSIINACIKHQKYEYVYEKVLPRYLSPEPHGVVDTLNADGILTVLVKLNKFDEAIQTFHDLIEKFKLVPDNKNGMIIVSELCKMGDIQKAYQFTKTSKLQEAYLLKRVMYWSFKMKNVRMVEKIGNELLALEAWDPKAYRWAYWTYKGVNNTKMAELWRMRAMSNGIELAMEDEANLEMEEERTQNIDNPQFDFSEELSKNETRNKK